MKAEFIIHAASPVGFNTKMGRVETVALVLLDRDPETPLVNTMDYQLDHRNGELNTYRDLKPGERVMLGITGWQAGMGQQGGRFRLQGRIVSRVPAK